MPQRVITVDIEGMLTGNVELIAVVGRPYNPTGLPAAWQGGVYLDAIVEGNVPDFGVSHAVAYEYTDDVPTQLLEAGVGHTFLGFERPAARPVPPPTGTRRAVVTLDVGAALGVLLTRAEALPVNAIGISRALQVLVDTDQGGGGETNGSNLHARAYDALDDHPVALATALQKLGVNRRQTSSDPPIGWEQRRGGP